MGSREDKHTKHRPTKEEFYKADGGDANPSTKGYHSGPLIDADAESGYCTVYIPKDYDKIEEIVIVVIPQATLVPMTIGVHTGYGFNGQPEDNHTNAIGTLSFTAPGNDIVEVDIQRTVNFDGGICELEPGDYIGVRLTRAAGQNANLIYLGVRIKYKYK